MQSSQSVFVVRARACACVVVSVETSNLRSEIYSLLSSNLILSHQCCVSTVCGVTPTGVICCLHFTLSSSPTRLAWACFTQLTWVFDCDTAVGIQRGVYEAAGVRSTRPKWCSQGLKGQTGYPYLRVVEFQNIIEPQINTKNHRPPFDKNLSLLFVIGYCVTANLRSIAYWRAVVFIQWVLLTVLSEKTQLVVPRIIQDSHCNFTHTFFYPCVYTVWGVT